MTTIVCLIFFLSGASALIFEVVWFQVSGIVFGNSIWATTIVLSSYMLGLGLGSGLVAFKGRFIAFPLRFYACLEITIGFVGFFIVLLLPAGTGMLSALFAHVLDKPVLLNSLRAAISFSVMAIGTTAMGATLPVLVKALYAQNRDFGAVLGRLYGWNTIGAVAGVIAADALFIRLFGIKGTGLAACLLSFIAAGTALYLDKVKTAGPQRSAGGVRSRIKLPVRAVRLLAASFFTGFSILALEVIWFRFIILFYTPYTWIFCAMLATVLAGIGLGGLLSAQLFKGAADRHASMLPMLFLNAIVIIAGYAFFGQVLPLAKHYSPDLGIFLVTFFLIFPGCCVSGILFPLIGRLLHDEAGEEATSAGLLTLFNTMGGLAGSLAGVAFFIPVLGMENSVFSIGLFYACLGLLFLQRLVFQNVKNRRGIFPAVAAAGLAASLVFFPFGRMGKTYLDLSLGTYASMGLKRVAVREGVTETVQCLQKDILDKPYFHVILTNNHSMSSTFFKGRRYMKLYVFLPAALHRGLKNALLIGYGCGSTAKALTDTKGLRSIDVVDISRNIVETSRILYPDPGQNPTLDPRVRVHIEDGRFFLLATHKTYDLITAEPPPPKHNGVVNLYTKEYFQLLYDRLADGGYVTYWLPVYQFSVDEAKAVIRAFSTVFRESSLWTASEYEWMLLGVKNPRPPVSSDQFSAQWRDPSTAAELHALGFFSPQQLGSLFIADGNQLRKWVDAAPPLVDNFPLRLSHTLPDVASYLPVYSKLTDAQASCSNFVQSSHIAKTWPKQMIDASVKYFESRQIINELITNDRRKTIAPELLLAQAVSNPLLQSDYILWAMESDAYAQNIISANMDLVQRMIREGDIQGLIPISGHLAARLTLQGDYITAEKYARMASDAFGPAYLWNSAAQIREYLLSLAGQKR